MARCGAFSGTTRPVHTADPPPAPSTHVSRSTPLPMIRSMQIDDHAAALVPETDASAGGLRR